jgi:glycosyltransferase involved in cell wall biosynthesis
VEFACSGEYEISLRKYETARYSVNKARPDKCPFISVLMAVRNTARFLPQAIEGVLNDTYSNFEFLIYDDVSTDDSPAILAGYARQDSRIRIYTGEQKAPNFAYIQKFLVGQSKGEYFTIPDSDDVCLPDRMQCLVAEVNRKPSASIVFGWHRMVDEECVKTLEVFGEPIWPLKYFVGGFVHPGASLISRRYYDMTDGFDATVRWSADRDMCFKMLEQSPFSHVGKVVYIYRRHMASRTFERPSDYDAIAIIAEKALGRNTAIAEDYLERGVKNITYHEYVALSYVTAHLVMDVLGPRRGDADVVERLTRALGFSYQSFLRLEHNIDVSHVRTLDQLRSVIVKEVEKIGPGPAYGKLRRLFRKAKKLRSFLRT